MYFKQLCGNLQVEISLVPVSYFLAGRHTRHTMSSNHGISCCAHARKASMNCLRRNLTNTSMI